MSRNRILALGALLWAVVGVQQSVRIATGDWTGTAIVAAGGIAWALPATRALEPDQGRLSPNSPR